MVSIKMRLSAERATLFNSCIALLMKQRKTEVALDDGQIERFMKKYQGKNVLNVEKK
jgi:hypothetical protein